LPFAQVLDRIALAARAAKTGLARRQMHDAA
jgi:hypothetical protein